jgi:dUTP pyrophosphatase
MIVRLKRLDASAHLPDYAHDNDAGCDLYSNEECGIAPGARALVRTGIAMAIPDGFVGLVWDKSGLAVKQGLHRLAGVIDSGYRGEIQVALINLGNEQIQIAKGQKIAQLLFQKVEHAQLEEVKDLDATARGASGFGSTGLHKKEGK